MFAAFAGRNFRLACGFDEREQHGKRLLRFDGVAQIRRHEQKRSGFERVPFAVEAEFTFAGKNFHQRLLRGHVFSQFLSFGKSKEHDPQIGRGHERAAGDSVGRKLRFRRERQDFRRANAVG